MSTTPTSSSSTSASQSPMTIGVFGGSFNPIHLGHALLAVTVVQTKDYVDAVVLVPVYKHAVKRDLLPFSDRVNMCRLAVQHFASNISVSTVEQDVGASNGAMLQALKARYPVGTRLVWICGDDFFQWMHTPKGLETLTHVDGLIVQRRLHRRSSDGHGHGGGSGDADRFYKDPIDELAIHDVIRKHKQNNQQAFQIDYIYGELPHFSSTLVRRAPGHWKSFLTTAVATYLQERPALLQQLMENLKADDDEASPKSDDQYAEPAAKKHKRTPSMLEGQGRSALVVLRGLEVVHLLQKERGHASLFLSSIRDNNDSSSTVTTKNDKHHKEDEDMVNSSAGYQRARTRTDAMIKEIMDAAKAPDEEEESSPFVEVRALAAELKRIPMWLTFDRKVLDQYAAAQKQKREQQSNNNNSHKSAAVDAWLERLDLVEKFDPRIDVIMGGTVRALTEILYKAHQNKQEKARNKAASSSSSQLFNRDIPELFRKWLEGKEMLGRERAVVCSGGPHVPDLVRASLKMRQRTLQIIDTKERTIARVLELQETTGSAVMMMTTAPEALHKLLEQLTRLEYTLMGAFATSTPIPLVHRLLASSSSPSETEVFDVKQFFQASTAAIDFLLSFAKALAASALASA
eukprot:scaffold3143_cov164-Amphora_coffeaeformis.AAC.5